ncbi:hypothetical protein SELR_07840 [Selenomonas ruminantium subsp. lactilytica TAM6421]|uniref:Uncharacterized protein n=1 Tax=Selenomonas ruminantium subsp. lactilytica (strain NBRC 103574 / TAM6421) TaxID=927704 RepID=I0GP05_SELRL|nr:hypothetical protein SELR_07840 [Selenomonas ruminantium subsp. lactilytica TAM6421]
MTQVHDDDKIVRVCDIYHTITAEYGLNPVSEDLIEKLV